MATTPTTAPPPAATRSRVKSALGALVVPLITALLAAGASGLVWYGGISRTVEALDKRTAELPGRITSLEEQAKASGQRMAALESKTIQVDGKLSDKSEVLAAIKGVQEALVQQLAALQRAIELDHQEHADLRNLALGRR